MVTFQLALFFVAIIVVSLNSRALGSSIAFCLGLTVAIDTAQMGFLLIAYISSLVLSAFRD